MPWPSADKVANVSTGETTDLNWLWSWGAGQPLNVCSPDYGADPTGAADSAAAFQAAFDDANAAASGAVIYVPPGTYRLNGTVTAEITSGTKSVIFQGAGMQATVLKYYGSGDCLRMLCSGWTGANYAQGSGIRDLTIDGASAAAGACGLHVGDIGGLHISHCQIRNFDSTGAKGIWLENTLTWTEQADVRAFLLHNRTQVTFSYTAPGTNSFGYGEFDFTMWEGGGSNHDGVSMTAAMVYGGHLRLRGNFNAATSALSNCVLRMASNAQISAAHVQIQVECNDTGGGTANRPVTIIADAGSQINGYGILDFSLGGSATPFTPSSLNTAQVRFSGFVTGDTGLTPAAGYNIWLPSLIDSPAPLSAGVYGGSGFGTTTGDVFTHTLASNITANLTSTYYDGTKTRGVPQRVTVIIKQAAAGGPYTVTWPKPGSPTTSAPAVYWAGGTAPVMTATAGATDIYELVTYDGVRWYGRATQNVS